MTVENISCSISMKECCRPRRRSNPRPPGLQSDAHPTEPLRLALYLFLQWILSPPRSLHIFIGILVLKILVLIPRVGPEGVKVRDGASSKCNHYPTEEHEIEQAFTKN